MGKAVFKCPVCGNENVKEVYVDWLDVYVGCSYCMDVKSIDEYLDERNLR